MSFYYKTLERYPFLFESGEKGLIDLEQFLDFYFKMELDNCQEYINFKEQEKANKKYASR